MLQPQQLFAERYRIVKPLAEGGMGAVFVAQHTATEALVALKVLWPHLIELDRARRSFELEAKIAARVRSEHIVKVLDAGLDTATRAPFLVMELLEGVTLAEHVWRAGPRPFAETANWLEQAARGLDAAHGYRNAAGAAEPIVHRDLKPENLFLTLGSQSAPLVKILDFGIAKVLGESTHLSQEVRGTPLYMAYEQVAGEVITPRTDVWALGLIAYFLLTGRSYWRAVDQVQALFAEILNLPFPAPSQRAREDTPVVSLPAGFDAWLFGCIDRDPNRRFASAGEAARAFAALEASTSSVRGPVSASAVEPLAPVRTIPAVEGADALVFGRAPVSSRASGGSAGTPITPGSVPSLTTALPAPSMSALPRPRIGRASLLALSAAVFTLLIAGIWTRFGVREQAAPARSTAVHAEPPRSPNPVEAPRAPALSGAVDAPSASSAVAAPSAGARTAGAAGSARPRRAAPLQPSTAKPRASSVSTSKKPPAFIDLPP